MPGAVEQTQRSFRGRVRCRRGLLFAEGFRRLCAIGKRPIVAQCRPRAGMWAVMAWIQSRGSKRRTVAPVRGSGGVVISSMPLLVRRMLSAAMNPGEQAKNASSQEGTIVEVQSNKLPIQDQLERYFSQVQDTASSRQRQD